MRQGDFTEVAKHYHHRPAYSEVLLEKLLAMIESMQDQRRLSFSKIWAWSAKKVG